MAELNPVRTVIDGTYDAPSDRRHTGQLLAPAGGLTARGGCKPGTMALTPGAGLSVDVASGTVWVQSTAADGGVYECHNAGPTRKTLTPADAALPRQDRVYARVADTAGSERRWDIAVLTGTPSSNPVPPALPVGAEPIGRVPVPANASSIVAATLIDDRRYTTALGGIVPAPVSALPSNPYGGMTVWGYGGDRDQNLQWRRPPGSTVYSWVPEAQWGGVGPRYQMFRRVGSGMDSYTAAQGYVGLIGGGVGGVSNVTLSAGDYALDVSLIMLANTVVGGVLSVNVGGIELASERLDLDSITRMYNRRYYFNSPAHTTTFGVAHLVSSAGGVGYIVTQGSRVAFEYLGPR